MLKKTDAKRVFGAVLGIVIAVVFVCLPVPDGLTHPAMVALGITLWAIIYWIFQVFSIFITSMLMCALFALTGVVPFTHAYSGFSSSTWWFMLAALGMSLALTKTGLMKRFAYSIMKLFSPTYKGQVLGLIASGIIINPFIPSATAKLCMGVPIAESVGEAMGYEKKSNGMHGLFLAVVTGFMLMSVCFISANFFGYIAFGLLPAETQAEFTWIKWFISMLPWGVVVAVGCLISIWVLYRPKEEKHFSKGYVNQELAAMGPMTMNEKLTLGVFLVAVVLWALQKIINVDGTVVAVFALLIFLIFNVIDVSDFKTKIPWDMLFMVGSMISFGSILNELKIQTYISKQLAPYIGLFTGNPYIFITVVAIAIYLIRFIYVDQVSSITIFVVLLIPFAQAMSISPWICAMVVFTSILTWNVIYQNGLFLIGYSAGGGEESISFPAISKLSYIYMALNILGFWACIPFWHLLGIL
ncbi:SLC13 family permease [Clostridium sp. KNHs216]|uniref:SLC13 family permease n=1 Tax=Clostridium sp. KNHs216 TaxID=1550235 RepID=UPI00115437B1|nr:SLC13 family permease [Clostridium sp. KNHs216]TQI66323.1 DASS family divalent anion:Na+ symporter [Clostridium sp. KNHs216]